MKNSDQLLTKLPWDTKQDSMTHFNFKQHFIKWKTKGQVILMGL